jgi:hypothetical protein
MAWGRRLSRLIVLGSATLHGKLVGSNDPTEHAPCACVLEGPRTATLVLADGASGSTWLGQMLESHPCSSAFAHNSTRLDGKTYVKCVFQRWVMMMCECQV